MTVSVFELLPELRGFVEQSVLSTTASWVRPVRTGSALGGFTSSDEVLNAELPCRVQRLSGREAEDDARTSSGAEWVLSVPAETAVRVEDALIVAGRRYEVVALEGGDAAVLLQVWCR